MRSPGVVYIVRMKCVLFAASALVLVLAACGGGYRVPGGVAQIDVRQPGVVSRSVTNLFQVDQIINWFDALKPPSKTKITCAGGPAMSVTFTFLSANGSKLARAYSAPFAAGPCDSIQFTAHGQRVMFLWDRDLRRPLIDRVQRLLGVKFGRGVYYG
jgi:hypothetical protein